MLLSERKDLTVFALANITWARSSKSSIARTLGPAADFAIVGFSIRLFSISVLHFLFLDVCKCEL